MDKHTKQVIEQMFVLCNYRVALLLKRKKTINTKIP